MRRSKKIRRIYKKRQGQQDANRKRRHETKDMKMRRCEENETITVKQRLDETCFWTPSQW